MYNPSMSTTTMTTASPPCRDTADNSHTQTATPPAIRQPTENQALHPGIQPYNPSTDRPGIEAVFREVYTSLYRFADLTRIAFIVFCRAYLDISPETCFVLSMPTTSPNGSPRILGYIVGTPSSSAFCTAFSADRGGCRTDIETTPAAPSREEMRDPVLQKKCMDYFRGRNQWVHAVSQGMTGIEGIVFSNVKALLEDGYPAHFHVAVLPEARRRGFGSRLLDTLSRALQDRGVRGVFAATSFGNEAAQAMYQKCGFQVLDDEDEDKDASLPRGGEAQMEKRVLVVKTL